MLDYDGWNGGTTSYSFGLHVPVPIYAEIEPKIDEMEVAIKEKIERLLRGETHNFISKVLIQPKSKEPTQRQLQSHPEFWLPSHFRLFISHLGEDRNSAQRLATTLRGFGISSFVAHEDIEPTREWQLEIDRALFSMDALAALLSPGFGRSNWTDHEVGVAIGREKLVLPLMYGRNPYGLISKYQGLKVKGRKLSEVGQLIFRALMKNSLTSTKLVSCLVDQFMFTDDIDAANRQIELLENAGNIRSDLLDRIREKSISTSTIYENIATRYRVNSLLQKHGGEIAEKPSFNNENSDEMPF